MRQTPLLAFCIVVAAYAVHLFLAWPELPDQLASHFSATGAADGWSSKASFFGIQAVIATILFGIFALLPVLLRRLPRSLINLPHKDYWLAEERVDQTMMRISNSMLKMGIASFLFLIMVNREVFYANKAVEPSLSDRFLYMLILFVVYICWVSFSLWYKFRRIPAHS